MDHANSAYIMVVSTRAYSTIEVLLYWMQSHELQTQRLIPAHHQIHALHCRTGGALHEIVDRAHRHDMSIALVQFKTQISIIRASKIFGSGTR